MNKFQNTVIQLAKKREEQEFDAFEKKHGTYSDFVELRDKEMPGKCYTGIEFVYLDKDGYDNWSKEFDKLRDYKVIKREVAAELRKGSRL